MTGHSIGSGTIERHNMTSNRATHVVLIPSYNTGARLFDTVAGVRARGVPVIVVIDGSTDGSGETLTRVAERDPDLFACVLPTNLGKGAAVLRGLRLAQAMGFTHALAMDADGQHSADHIGEMIDLSLAHPEMMVLGQPLFDASAPGIRIFGHRIANFCTGLVTRSGSIGDSLFGFRVYPIPPLIEVFESTSGMRQFDFDSEAVIRLYWRGVHFRYVRDNILLAAMYLRLLAARLAGPASSALRPTLPSPAVRRHQ
jgi:hypothetical protein